MRNLYDHDFSSTLPKGSAIIDGDHEADEFIFTHITQINDPDFTLEDILYQEVYAIVNTALLTRDQLYENVI